MAILGGSPLGLIGLKSIPTVGGQSTFNGGATRNVSVVEYNRSRAGTLFSGKRRLRAWPDLKGKFVKNEDGSTVEGEVDTLGTSDVRFADSKGKTTYIDGYKSPMGDATHRGQNVLHNNDVYDTSILNLVEKLSGTKGALRPSDFAYLKDVGVYPNNRLQICRRFVAPSGDNIMVKASDIGSLGTMISWIPENDNFLEITFGEEWESAKADFTGMLNSLGEDFSKTNLGGIVGAAGGAIPLPGFTEIFQREFLRSMGLLDSGAAASIPAGNPNLIKEAKVRKTIGYGSAGSGLKCKVSVKMVCEYELKFISGIDPTIVWMDLIGTIVRFGTSNSSNYGLSQKVAATLGRWSRDPNTLLTDVVAKLQEVISIVQAKLMEGYEIAKVEAYAAAEKLKPEIDEKTGEPVEKKEPSPDKAAKTAANEVYNASKKLLNTLVSAVQKAIKGSIMKYRVEIMGIVNALSGNPSTPWHLTIGNPLRPVFCSGDMLVEDVTLKLGPILAFNDLPSSITAEFTVANARPWGMQEIMAKFNSGYLRTVDIQKTFFETTLLIAESGNSYITEPTGILPGATQSVDNSSLPVNATIVGTPSTATNNVGPTPSNSNLTNLNSTIPNGQTGSNANGQTFSATDNKEPLKSNDTGTKSAPGSLLPNPFIQNNGLNNSTLTSQTKLTGGGKI